MKTFAIRTLRPWELEPCSIVIISSLSLSHSSLPSWLPVSGLSTNPILLCFLGFSFSSSTLLGTTACTGIRVQTRLQTLVAWYATQSNTVRYGTRSIHHSNRELVYEAWDTGWYRDSIHGIGWCQANHTRRWRYPTRHG